MISDKISKLVKEHLPETVSEELKKFIEDAEINKAELHNANLKINELQKNIKDLRAQLAMCDNCNTRYSEIAHKENVVSLKEDHCLERVNDMKDILSLVFKSPVYRKSTTRNKNAPVDRDGYVSYENTS